jgi:ketosteroid isomerase-like protein
VSQENVDAVKAGFDALQRGDVEELLPRIHREFEFTTPPALSVEPDTYRGEEGLRRYFDSFYEVMDEVQFIPDEFIDAGERVVVPVSLRARGKETGLEVEQRIFQVWSVRDGKAARVEVFATLEEAMEAAGAAGGGPT